MIVRSCIRMAAVMALRNSTWADERVFDSDNTPLAEAVTAANAPFVVVYTEDDDSTAVNGRDMLSPERRQLKLVLEFGIAGSIPMVEGGSQVAIPATDDALERAVDILEYQVTTHLFHTPSNPWGELVRQLCPVVHNVTSLRAGEAERGVRWAARQRVMLVDTVADPTPGEVLSPENPIAKFLAAAKTNDDAMLGQIATLIESVIASSNAPSWRRAQAALGLSEDEVRGIGVAPPYLTPDLEVDLSKITFDRDDDEHTTADNADDMLSDDIMRPLPDDPNVVIISPEETRI